MRSLFKVGLGLLLLAFILTACFASGRAAASGMLRYVGWSPGSTR